MKNAVLFKKTQKATHNPMRIIKEKSFFVSIMVTFQYIIMYLKFNLYVSDSPVKYIVYYYMKKKIILFLKKYIFVEFLIKLIVKDHSTHYFDHERQSVTSLNDQTTAFVLPIDILVIGWSV